MTHDPEENLTRLSVEGDVVVVVLYDIRPGCRDRFLDLAATFARQMMNMDPACRLYCVAAFDEHPNTVVFTEVYETPEAFARHQSSAELADFRSARSTLVQAVCHRVWHRAVQLQDDSELADPL